MKKPNVHIIFQDNGWIIQEEGFSAPTKLFATQAGAKVVGKELARHNKSRLIVHTEFGVVCESISFEEELLAA